LGVSALWKKDPGNLKRDASSTENGRFLGVWEFGLDKFVSRAPGGEPEVIHRLSTVIGEFGSLRA
tara:strand:- start:92 stop:286 length:195 start_codon:yes stop_codon:yes gene_type:complete